MVTFPSASNLNCWRRTLIRPLAHPSSMIPRSSASLCTCSINWRLLILQTEAISSYVHWIPANKRTCSKSMGFGGRPGFFVGGEEIRMKTSQSAR